MSGIFPEDVQKAAEKMNHARIKAAEFEGGLTLKIKGVEKVKSQFGATEDSSIVEKGILDEGEQFKYTFEDAAGDERTLWSTSLPFFSAMQGAEINIGDTVLIKRDGQKANTRYTVEVVKS